MILPAETSLLPTSVYATLPLWPLAGALAVGILIARRARPELAHWPAIAGTAVSAILGVLLPFDLHNQAPADQLLRSPAITRTLWSWISHGFEESLRAGRFITVSVYIDRLTAVMLAFVTLVSLMVIIYSVGYMRHHNGEPERGYQRFFTLMSLFVFAMCTLVLAGNFVLLYLGWEAVGLCSYLLIGFYYARPAAACAAKKAFLVNRIGDTGFALGIFALYSFLHHRVPAAENPLDFAVAFRYIAELPDWQRTLVALLLTCGAIGKSAQFPLHIWLPDAMEGPTPVSALIHAATMVTAGVYLIARCGPIFETAPLALDSIVAVAAIGALLAATIACAQYDMKRILAYSTISQLALMFAALGCAASASAIFHVFTHAFFKALLFLGAGSVMHAMGGVIDLRRFSGLHKVLPWTWCCTLVGCLALAGFPGLSGFFSKDEILHAAFTRHPALGMVLLVTSGLTAYYSFRMFFMCFHGPRRLPAEAGQHPHESPPVMLAPLFLLALGAILAGYVNVGGHFDRYVRASGLSVCEAAHDSRWLYLVSGSVALAGIGLAWLRYGAAPAVDPDARLLGRVFGFWSAGYYFNELYDRLFVRNLRRLARFCLATDDYAVDAAVGLVAAIPRGAGGIARLAQRGSLQGYALGMAIGLTAMLVLWHWLA
jgi:NADH-quinone oxidoreductase subunit L